MNKEIKTKWLKALRSKRYKQTTGTLCDRDGGYCCLGVLARIQGAKKENLFDRGILKADLAKYAAGLRIQSQNILADLNDDGKDFIQIADYIEKKYK